MGLRNHLYKIGYKKSFTFQVPIIAVGNLSLGGNGKTPMVEYIIEQLRADYSLATLSRGYSRKTRGFRLGTDQDDATTLGDEPFQIMGKYGPEVTVAVGEDRALAIPTILQEKPQTQAIILDDAFQHRTVRPQLNILVTAFSRPFFRDWMLPAGRLREFRTGAQRADIIVVTKCPPGLKPAKQHQYQQSIEKYAPKAQVFFSTTEAHEPQAIFTSTPSWPRKPGMLLISGIAFGDTFETLVQDMGLIMAHIQYGDHHRYGERDLNRIRREFNSLTAEHKIILTTEKDMVKLKALEKEIGDLPLYFLPIKFRLLQGADIFNQQIFNALESVDSEL